jgi:hypothetical protein
VNWRLAVLVAIGAAILAAQTGGPVISAGPLLHMVSDLDRSIAFYHDQFGFEFARPADDHKFQDNPAVANLYGVPGKQFRVAILKIPGSTMNLEMAEWRDAKPLDDDGWAALTITQGNHGLDPDGLLIVAAAKSLPTYLSVKAKNVSKSVALYSKVLGFKAEGDWLSTPDNALRIEIVSKLPDSASKGPPSRAMLRLRVRDIDAVTASMKSAGFYVVTTGGMPVTLPGGPRAIILRDPNNFYWQPMELPHQ